MHRFVLGGLSFNAPQWLSGHPQELCLWIGCSVSEWKLLSRVRLFATPWTVACQAPLSMGFSKQESWSGLPFPPPGHLPHLGVDPPSPALAGGFFSTAPPGKSLGSPPPCLLNVPNRKHFGGPYRPCIQSVESMPVLPVLWEPLCLPQIHACAAWTGRSIPGRKQAGQRGMCCRVPRRV